MDQHVQNSLFDENNPISFVNLKDFVEDAIYDFRYSTPYNFTGKVVPGYEKVRTIITSPAAVALKEARDSLKYVECVHLALGKNDAEKAVIVKSEVPKGLVGKGYASSSTVSWTMYQKFANGLPLFRQEKDWLQYGAAITRTTLANWIIYCAETYFQPLYDYFHRELIKRQFLMADETRVQVLDEPEYIVRLALLLPCIYDGFCRTLAHVLDTQKPEADAPVLPLRIRRVIDHCELLAALIDVRRQNIDVHVLAVSDIQRHGFGIAHDRSHQSRHEFHGMVAF